MKKDDSRLYTRVSSDGLVPSIIVIKKRTRSTSICLAMVLALALAGAAGCGAAEQEVREVEQEITESAQAGKIEGTMQVVGRFAIEQSAKVRLTGNLDCTAGELSGTNTPVECSGQTADGMKASVKGIVTSAEPVQAVVKGKFTLTFDGKKIAELDCLGFC